MFNCDLTNHEVGIIPDSVPLHTLDVVDSSVFHYCETVSPPSRVLRARVLVGSGQNCFWRCRKDMLL